MFGWIAEVEGGFEGNDKELERCHGKALNYAHIARRSRLVR